MRGAGIESGLDGLHQGQEGICQTLRISDKLNENGAHSEAWAATGGKPNDLTSLLGFVIQRTASLGAVGLNFLRQQLTAPYSKQSRTGPTRRVPPAWWMGVDEYERQTKNPVQDRASQ